MHRVPAETFGFSVLYFPEDFSLNIFPLNYYVLDRCRVGASLSYTLFTSFYFSETQGSLYWRGSPWKRYLWPSNVLSLKHSVSQPPALLSAALCGSIIEYFLSARRTHREILRARSFNSSEGSFLFLHTAVSASRRRHEAVSSSKPEYVRRRALHPFGKEVHVRVARKPGRPRSLQISAAQHTLGFLTLTTYHGERHIQKHLGGDLKLPFSEYKNKLCVFLSFYSKPVLWSLFKEWSDPHLV